jgi:ABC-type lipoprotein release transport system permease subunit
LLAFAATPSLALFLAADVRPHDLTVFAFTLGVLGAGAMTASVSPVLKALRVDPAVALRYE